MAKALCFLTCFHLLFFRRFYFQNPYCYARGELLEQAFSSSSFLGDQLRKGHFPPQDEFYYPDYAGLPFLSTFYIPHLLQAWLGSFLPLNSKWILFCFMMVFHSWCASVSVYILVSAMGLAPWPAGLFSLAASYSGYTMKPCSSILYTTAWIPSFLLLALCHHSCGFGISLGMMLLAGYWPLALPATFIGGLVWLMK